MQGFRQRRPFRVGGFRQCDESHCRAWSIGVIASGPVSFMRIRDSMCATLLSVEAGKTARPHCCDIDREADTGVIGRDQVHRNGAG